LIVHNAVYDSFIAALKDGLAAGMWELLICIGSPLAAATSSAH
jgi:hypothetical protein